MDSKDCDQTTGVDAQTDLSLRWVHMPFCWFCHEAAQILLHFHELAIFVSINMRLEDSFCAAWK